MQPRANHILRGIHANDHRPKTAFAPRTDAPSRPDGRALPTARRLALDRPDAPAYSRLRKFIDFLRVMSAGVDTRGHHFKAASIGASPEALLIRIHLRPEFAAFGVALDHVIVE